MKNITIQTLENAQNKSARTVAQKVARAKNFGQVKVTVCKDHKPTSRNRTIKVKGANKNKYWDKRYSESV